uniref:Uncharacterized protein n=1 Tax=Kwoniella dejecticola CBS 10117 TaxID=1296121 RepID=A0A1A6A131_9TREE|nr:uncharacterized protein I303_06051 [Kwoniella dejecticola CBS 10117]OBR83769.1 hypothetical protein I303_06051 [Kwoniella dejecticola CBS 10117]
MADSIGIPIAGPSTMFPTTSISTNINTPIPASTPTILESLNTLLVAHQTRNLSLTHLHPYAPLHISNINGKDNGKGKGKGKDRGNLAVISDLRQSVARLRATLEGPGSGDGEVQGRLIRGLKEISTHQPNILALLPTLQPSLASNLSSGSSSGSGSGCTPLFPSKSLLLSPTKLLEKISLESGLQCFIEDPQFGLMRSSLAIAGGRFVCDVDLSDDLGVPDAEADAEGEGEGEGEGEEGGEGEGVEKGEDDDDMGMNPNTHNGTTATEMKTKQGSTSSGKIRLSKISVNHITLSGTTAKSTYITSVLKSLIERYLDAYYDDHLDDFAKEGVLRELEDGLSELRVLDEYSAGAEDGKDGKDGFEELERVVKVLDQFSKSDDGNSSRIYNAESRSIFPTFHLLPPTLTSPLTPTPTPSEQCNQSHNPSIKIRPSRPGETIPSPTLGGTANEDVNMEDSANVASNWAKEWIVEIKDDLVVRRNFLDPTTEGEESDLGVMNGVKVENLLYRPYPAPPLPSLAQQIQLFPYASTFSHSSASSSSGMLEQRWSMVQPGPEAFVVGRIGVPSASEGLGRLLNVIRNQIVLNRLFSTIFKVENLVPDQVDQAGEDGQDVDDMGASDLEDLLAGGQRSIPINMSLTQSSIEITFPLISISSDNGKSQGQVKDVHLIVRPSAEERQGFMDIRVDGEVFNLHSGAALSLLDVVREVIDKKNKVELGK